MQAGRNEKVLTVVERNWRITAYSALGEARHPENAQMLFPEATHLALARRAEVLINI